ncbi:MAG: type I DNA topoisomerase [Clostridia bacterium]|nr:type I DNA topoisomerase [Clostridia bacterium]
MADLVIVESPTKVKSIQKYLGDGYQVMASMGHIRDLPKSKLGIDVEHDFAPQYVNMSDKRELIKKLKEAATNADKVYLATDPDREGEAISWHLAQLLALDINSENRLEFNEITKTGVQNGFAHPRKLDLHLVDAQQARRVLDRLVGYKLSPFLWKKVRRGLSAGRVQSVALKLIVDREKEIEAFVPEEFWELHARFSAQKVTFSAKLHSDANGQKVEMKEQADADRILQALQGAEYTVSNVKKGVRNRQPAAPFITSTLQQEASRKLGFQAQRTMRIAQQLYEGIEVAGHGSTGLITYMRTDSLRISNEARTAAKNYIAQRYGAAYLPKTDRFFKTKSGAQDAHEAIRPTSMELTPEAVKSALTPEQYKLYKLIWDRFVASLMSPCVQDTVSVDITGNDYLFRASGYKIRFDGFTVLYSEGKDEEDEANQTLPELQVGDKPELKALEPSQHFTQPPARYSEPTLIKALDENGIGRPSTYAPILANILQREYIERDKKSLKPTALGITIADLISVHFKKIVNVKFTANMETSLDKISVGTLEWVDVISEFYEEFDKALRAAEQSLDGVRVKVPDVESDIKCELCGRTMVIKNGRFGKFLACPGYPECKNTKPIVVETKGECPKCGAKVLQKKSKTGHKYFGCEHNPKCDFMTWDDPTAERCPDCGKSLFKARGGILHCLNEGCGFEKKAPARKTKTGGKKA